MNNKSEPYYEVFHITFSCYHKKWLFKSPELYRVFQEHLNNTCKKHSCKIYGYVLMPNHVHLLIAVNENIELRKFIGLLKRKFSFYALKYLKVNFPELYSTLNNKYGNRVVYRFWQRGSGNIQTIKTEEQFFKTLEYIHNNPVKSGIVEETTDWHWSSDKYWSFNLTDHVNLDKPENMR